jgi:hypothetical protein
MTDYDPAKRGAIAISDLSDVLVGLSAKAQTASGIPTLIGLSGCKRGRQSPIATHCSPRGP